MQPYKLVIFDWDGTLMDSIGRIVSSMQAAARECSFEVPTVFNVKQIIGLSLDKAITVLFPTATATQQEALVAEYKHQYITVDKTPTPLFEHAIDLLKLLKTNKVLLAVATGKARQGLDRVLEQSNTAHLFHASRCADEANSKPDPQMLFSLLDALKVKPENAVMIGDTSHDLKMAQLAGIDSIGVTLGVHDSTILNQYNPKAVVNSLDELTHLLLPTYKS